MRVRCHTCSLPLCRIWPLEATDWATLLGRGEDDVSRMMDLLYGWMLFSRDIVDLLMGDDLHDMLDAREPRVTYNISCLRAARGHPYPAPVPAVFSVHCAVHFIAVH